MTEVLHILLVDDEQIVRDTLGDYLVDCGYHVRTAEDGIEASSMLQQTTFDLVLADVRMPGDDGLALLQQLRTHDQDTPVIMMTGHGDAQMDSEAELRGASGFLLKPVRLVELDDLIRRLIGQREQQQ